MQYNLDELIEEYDKSIMNIDDYEEVWFIGDVSSSFSLRAGVISSHLNNFSGVVIGKISKYKNSRIVNQINSNSFWNLIGFDDFISRSKIKKILLVDFNDNMLGLKFGDYFRRNNIDVVDYIKLMNDLKLVHTYLSVDKEREYVIDNLAIFIDFINSLSDDLSRKTVLARLQSLISLDRKWLIGVSQKNDYFNLNESTLNSLSISDQEVFVDVGAAHGDTVAKFYNACKGNYKSIHAFEPDLVNYESLKSLCNVIPNANYYHMGLSDENGELNFFEDTDNRFGSRFVVKGNEKSETKSVKICKLDDIIDEATLIKIDVEGFECKVINGAREIIKKCGPSMHIAGYHYPWDIISIVQDVNKIRNYKNISIRHSEGSLYDTNIMFFN